MQDPAASRRSTPTLRRSATSRFRQAACCLRRSTFPVARDWSPLRPAAPPFRPCSCAPGCDAASVAVIEETLLGDVECLVISTAAAKYYYGKRGAGFARILDPEGHDWISYQHGGKSTGEYRGLAKSGKPVKYFHCGYG